MPLLGKKKKMFENCRFALLSLGFCTIEDWRREKQEHLLASHPHPLKSQENFSKEENLFQQNILDEPPGSEKRFQASL